MRKAVALALRAPSLVLVLLLGLLLGITCHGPTAAAATDAPQPPLGYAYDSDHISAALMYATTERGPPTFDCTRSLTIDAADRWSRGASARSAEASPVDAISCDHPAPFAQSARTAGTTTELAGRIVGHLREAQRSSVAANGGSALTERQIGRTMDDVLDGANFLKQAKATPYAKPGGFGQANSDFNALTQGVGVIERGGGLRTATLSNGTKVNVRPFSSGNDITLEVVTPGNPALKIRYTP